MPLLLLLGNAHRGNEIVSSMISGNGDAAVGSPFPANHQLHLGAGRLPAMSFSFSSRAVRTLLRG